MTTNHQDVAQRCMTAAYAGSLDFPTIVRTLIEAGFDGYHVDFRRGMATYHPVGHASVEVALAPTTSATTTPIAAAFDAAAVERAVREAQSKTPGYTFAGFCTKVMSAGCAGYMVSFSGRRVVYYGRTAEVHVEHFPK